MFALTLLLSSGTLALAHAQVQDSDPKAEAVVAALPGAVTLSFSEPVGSLVLRWLLPDGREVEAQGTLRGNDLVVAPVDGGEGSYVLNWRVASTDGHPVAGALIFAVGAPSGVAAQAAADAGSAQLAAAGRFALTLLLVIGVGAAVFDRIVASLAAGARRVALASTALAPPFAALALGLHGLDMLGRGTSGLADAAVWQAAGTAPVARSIGLAAVAALIGLTALSVRSKAVAILAWVIAAISFAMSGHAAEAPPRWLSGPALALHALALIFWLGALMPLAASLRRADAVMQLTRFSVIAVPMVILLIATGAALTVVQAGSLSALIASPWGAILGAKLVLVALLVALASWNRLVLTPALAAGRPEAPKRLNRSIRAEILLCVAILALASAFRLTPPPRIAGPAVSVYAHIHGAGAMADLSMLPGQTGQNVVMLGFMDGDFNPLVPQEVRLRFSDAGRGIGPIETRAEALPDGRWQTAPVTLPGAGPWDVTLDILISDFAKITLTGQVQLPP
ncbi:copper resistance CopC/CopD family protein [Cereibacter changlensis]|nr:CopD family protein [Cereibacter changlensis]